MERPAELIRKQRVMNDMIRDRRIKLDFNNVNISMVESVLSRGDEAMGQTILAVWKAGGRLEAWREFFNVALWEKALLERGKVLAEEVAEGFTQGTKLPGMW
jgi:hypothetical protein